MPFTYAELSPNLLVKYLFVFYTEAFWCVLYMTIIYNNPSISTLYVSLVFLQQHISMFISLPSGLLKNLLDACLQSVTFWARADLNILNPQCWRV
jgi:hypothetical protein